MLVNAEGFMSFIFVFLPLRMLCHVPIPVYLRFGARVLASSSAHVFFIFIFLFRSQRRYVVYGPSNPNPRPIGSKPMPRDLVTDKDIEEFDRLEREKAKSK